MCDGIGFEKMSVVSKICVVYECVLNLTFSEYGLKFFLNDYVHHHKVV